MQTLHKSTLDEASIIRQIVDSVVVSKDLLQPVKTKRIAAKLSQNNEGCSAASKAKYMLQKLSMQLLCCLAHVFVNSPNLTSIIKNGQYQAVKKLATLLGVRNVRDASKNALIFFTLPWFRTHSVSAGVRFSDFVCCLHP